MTREEFKLKFLAQYANHRGAASAAMNQSGLPSDYTVWNQYEKTRVFYSRTHDLTIHIDLVDEGRNSDLRFQIRFVDGFDKKSKPIELESMKKRISEQFAVFNDTNIEMFLCTYTVTFDGEMFAFTQADWVFELRYDFKTCSFNGHPKSGIEPTDVDAMVSKLHILFDQKVLDSFARYRFDYKDRTKVEGILLNPNIEDATKSQLRLVLDAMDGFETSHNPLYELFMFLRDMNLANAKRP